ncbi:Mfs1.1 [Trametes versicolor FP-101664 SS1]|uniref:Mfs1.1 n=1 Tax=Trametes versicolor (strain FP-101664) TaxID=717944 RepID=UPI0004621F99|nr:Mfs1.1 [Trametes versicolor FP-101664 SS1]EIW57867.1 Mfs1.1 [Trametes versicolor FP-101664 SS1]
MSSDVAVATPAKKGKGRNFWLSFTAVVVCNFLSALDLAGVSTALPTITDELNGGDKFVWVGAAYGLAAAAVIPCTGRLADILGRKPVLLTCVFFFFLGSALAGSAQNMNWLIGARAVQGIGGGGIINLALIVVSDLVPLAERGIYQGFLIMTWALAAAIGPIIGGSLAEKASWRWLFYLNLPLAGIAFFLVALFLRVRTPTGSLRHKLARIDWLGNALIIAGTTLVLIAVTWGGIRFPWDSAHVLGPLITGAVLLLIFLVYERTVPSEPTFPLDVLANRTSLAGYVATFFHGIVSISIIYYLPVYFQACKIDSPIRSSVHALATTLIASPFSIICGVLVKGSNKYRPANYIGWALTLIGVGLLTMLKADASTGQWVGFQILAAAGFGMIWASTVFPILAPVPVTRVAPALACYNFCRTFAQTWGIAISATILQNELKNRLPPAFVAQFPEGIEIAYAAIPLIPTLEPGLRAEVQAAFAASMSKVWFATLGFAAAGAATVFLLSEVPMQKYTDDAYALEEKPGRRGEVEMGLGKGVDRDSEERVAMKGVDSVGPTEDI